MVAGSVITSFGQLAVQQKTLGSRRAAHTSSRARLVLCGSLNQLLIAQVRDGAGSARLLCFSATGFTTELRAAAERDGQVSCIGLDGLYPAEEPR